MKINDYKKMFAMGIISITLPFGTFFVNLGGTATVPATQVVQVSQPLAPNAAATANTSLNWSGYVATGGNFTSVTGTWIVPSVSASSNGTTADATWVGIGGTTSRTLIQAGTQAVVNNGGTVSYEAWYETLPQATQPVTLVVSPGNSITASVAETSANEWQITLRNNTTGQSVETSLPYNASLSSAEWIEEMPSDETTFIPLDNFGTISFSAGSATENGAPVTIAQSGAQPITMINRGDQTLASPSALTSDGESFTVTRSAATPTIATVLPQGRAWRRTGVGVQGYTTGTSRTTSYRTRGNSGIGIQNQISFLRFFR